MNIAVIGAGAWGTAICVALGRKGGHRIRLWAYEKEVCESVNSRHVNDLFLAGQKLPDGVTASSDFAHVLEGARIVISVMPSHHTRRLFEQMKPHLRPDML